LPDIAKADREDQQLALLVVGQSYVEAQEKDEIVKPEFDNSHIFLPNAV
jgi:hypothetical protein